MLLLAFESSARSAAVALWRDGSLLGEYFQNSGQTHSRTLLKMGEDLLQNCDLSPRELTAVAAASGPGSFTGLRIGVSAAKGLAWGLEIPCIGVSTLEAMALGAEVMDGVVAACMDARRQQVYNALFSARDGTLTRMTEDRAISLEELAEELKGIEKPKFLVGDGAQLCYNVLCETIPLQLLPEHRRLQRASGVAMAAARCLESGTYPPAAEVRPNYLRLSQAEREREKKLQKNCEE